MVWVLERGRTAYGAGSSRAVSVVLDRAPIVGLPRKEEKFDMGVIGRLMKLFGTLYSTLVVIYYIKL